MLQFLAEVGSGSGLDAVAALTEIDNVQIIFQDNFFIVPLFQLRGTEDLLHLSLNGDLVRLEVVFDQLLGNGGATGIGAVHKHTDTGLDGGEPVHTLMLKEALVLNGHRGIDQILGDILVIHPFLLHIRVQLLQLLDIAVAVHIVDKGCLIQQDVVQLRIRIGQDILLQIVAQNAHKDHYTHTGHRQHRCQRGQHQLQQGIDQCPCAAQKSQTTAGLPALSGDHPSASVIFICHNQNLQKYSSQKARSGTVFHAAAIIG